MEGKRVENYFPQISTCRIASKSMLKTQNSFRPFLLMNLLSNE